MCNKKFTPGKLRFIGYILIPIGIVGFMLIVPPLYTPRNPSEYFWFWYSIRRITAFVFAGIGILGIVSLVAGLIVVFTKVKK